MLKADLHIHTDDELYDTKVEFSAKTLIDKAAALGYDVLAITLHSTYFYKKEIEDYAKEKGIILLPGVELEVENKHIIIINPNPEELMTVKKITDLKNISRDNTVIIAPHPFYGKKHCLGNKLLENIELFDGVEYCHFYLPYLNFFNKKAVQVAKTYNKPVIGNSDSHMVCQFGKNYSLIDAEKSKDAVIKAIKQGKVTLQTSPLTHFEAIKIFTNMFGSTIRNSIFGKRHESYSIVSS